MKATCVICQRSMPGQWNEWPEYPFCSKRCRTIDLGRWLDEGYRLPSQEGEIAEPDEES